MATRYKKYHFQLVDLPYGSMAGPVITGSGGMAQVCTQGSASKATIYDSSGAALTNPITLSGGAGDFYTLDTVDSVDLYIMCPNGQFVTAFAVKGDGMAEIPVMRGQKYQVAYIPFSIADSIAATEKDTGFDLPANAVVLPDVGIMVATIETAGAKTIDVGLLSSESGGDADGYIVAASTGTAGTVMAKSAATATRGAWVGAGGIMRRPPGRSQIGWRGRWLRRGRAGPSAAARRSRPGGTACPSCPARDSQQGRTGGPRPPRP